MTERIVTYSLGDCYAVIHNPKEDTHGRRSFYLRIGDSVDEITAQAKKEFKGKGVDFQFNTGKFQVKGDNLLVTPETSPTLTYLVAEALFYEGFDKSKTSADREPSRKLYDSVTGFVTRLEEFDKSLVDVLTDPEKPVLIKIAGIDPFSDLMRDLDYSKLARGFLADRRVAMNYGYILGDGATFFVDGGDTDSDSDWYVLPNSFGECDYIKGRFNDKAKLNTISKSSRFSFNEADKVSTRLYFDGTLRDLVDELVKKGIKLDSGLAIDDFSDK